MLRAIREPTPDPIPDPVRTARRAPFRDRLDLPALLVLAVVHALGVVALDLPSPVPMGDSFAFARSTRDFVETGRLVLDDWHATTPVGQILLAAPAALLFSPDPAVLNGFVQLLSFVAAAGFLAALRRAGASRTAARVGLAALVANPVWLSQSVSFNTEIAFLFFAALGTCALAAWSRSGSRADVWLAALAFAGAATVRIHGVFFAFAGLAATAPRAGRAWDRFAPWTLPLLATVALRVWLELGPGVPRSLAWQQDAAFRRLLDPAGFALWMAKAVFASLHYLALFALPMLLLAAGAGAKPSARGRTLALAASTVFVLATFVAAGAGMLMPYLGNVVLLEPLMPAFGREAIPAWLRAGPTLASLAACCWGSFVLARRFGAGAGGAAWPDASLVRFALVYTVAALGFSAFAGLYFERYLLPLVPFLLLALAPAAPVAKWRAALAGLVVVVLAAIGVFNLDQRLRLAHCEWETAHDALALAGGDPHRVDGGVAFNGYYSYAWLSQRFGRDRVEPWFPWEHPTAEWLVRTRAPDRPRTRAVGQRLCPNLPGLQPFQYWIYSAPPPAFGR